MPFTLQLCVGLVRAAFLGQEAMDADPALVASRAQRPDQKLSEGAALELRRRWGEQAGRGRRGGPLGGSEQPTSWVHVVTGMTRINAAVGDGCGGGRRC